MLPNNAVVEVEPIAVPKTMPVWLPTVAVNGSLDVQVTCVVMLAVVLSEYVPVAIRFAVVPLGSVADAVMLMLVRTASVTVMLASGEVMLFMEAKTVVEPTSTPFTEPSVPTVAVAIDAECQVTCVLMTAWLPSE